MMLDILSKAALSLSVFPLSTIAKAALILAAALLAVQCARQARAATRHLILACAFAVVLVLPLIELTVPAVTLFIAQPVAAVPPRETLPIVVAAPVTPAEPLASEPPRPAGERRPEGTRPSLGTLFVTLWAIGAALSLMPLLITPGRLRRLRRTSRTWPEGEELVRTMVAGTHRPVAVLLHDDVAAPLTCGIVRPVIVLPARARDWPDQEVRQALTHELEHIRRADWPVHIATRAICSLHWFNPLAWIAWRQLSLEAERACDDAVLRIADGTAYAQQLVTLARQARTSPVPVLSMIKRGELSARVDALLDVGRTRGRLGFRHAAPIVALAALAAAAVVPLRAAPQGSVTVPDPATLPSFDVVSIRENRSGDQGQRTQRQPGRWVATNFALRPLLVFVFGLQPQQLVGGRDWIDSTRFDITASMTNDPPVTAPGTVGPLQLMVQRVLAERFKLAVHKELREMPSYALTLARSDGKLGRGIKPASIDCEAVMNGLLKSARLGGPPPDAPRMADGSPACGTTLGPDGAFRAGGITMPLFAQRLSGPAGRIVVDKTGLTGAFDLVVEFTPDPAAPGPPPLAGNNNPGIFTALEEQLGLKLQPQRGPIEVLVIDRVERPTEN